MTESERNAVAKRSKDLVESRRAKFEQELARLNEVIQKLPASPPDLRGKATLDSLERLQEVLKTYKGSAEAIVEQWPEMEHRATSYQQALRSAPDILKASHQDLLDKAARSKTATERERWETAAKIFEGASRHVSAEAGRVANVTEVLNRTVEELKGQVEFCDTVSRRLGEIPSNLTGRDLDDLSKEIELLANQFEKIMQSMRQLGEELDGASRSSTGKAPLPTS